MNDSESKLQQELLGDAERKAERALSRARNDAAKALAAVQDEQAKARVQRLEETRQEAEARARAITARVRHEISRRWLSLREAGLDELFAALLPRLEKGDGIDPEQSLRQLLCEALSAMGPVAATVRLAPESAAFLSAAAIAEVCSQAWTNAATLPSVSRTIDASLRPGVLVESADGRFVFDNTYATRLERLRGPLRCLASAGMSTAESDDESHV